MTQLYVITEGRHLLSMRTQMRNLWAALIGEQGRGRVSR